MGRDLVNSSHLPFNTRKIFKFLLQKCCRTEYATIAIRIFKYLSTPYLVLEPSFALSLREDQEGKQVDFKVTIPGDDYLFNEAWNKFFKPNLKQFVHELAPIITDQLKSAHRLLCSVGCANDKWDPVSFKRSAIEPHEQDQHSDSLDLLIDFARDIIEFLLEDDPKRAQTIIQEWTLSDTPILDRLAIYGVTIDSNCSPNEKLQKLLANNWLFVHDLKHEVFQLLKVAYPKADETIRQSLLKNVETHLANCERNEKDPATLKSRNYEVYNLLYWLKQNAPNCSLAHQKFKEFQDKHTDFQPREYPDLDWYISMKWGHQSPVTHEELLSKPVSQIIEFLITYQEKEILGPDREWLLSAVQKAVAYSFQWGFDLIKELEAREEWDTDLWDAIISGWRLTNLTEAQWKQVLQFLEHFKEIWRHRYSIAQLLKEKVKASEGSLPTLLLPFAETIVDRLWQEVEEDDEKEILNHINDWLTTAINHIGGIITQFWLLAVSRHQSQNENERQGILDEYKCRFERIISGKSNTAAMGRVILAKQLHFLFSLDHKWTREKILPLLNWDIDSQRAEQAWEGYLRWGKWNEALLPDLLPQYEQFYNNLPRDSESYDLLCVHSASIAVRSSLDSIQSGWLDKFIENVDEKVRKKWAAKITNQLTSLPQEAIKEIWDKWIRNNWSRLIDGIPVPLSSEEAGAMVKWVLALQPVFSEVVALIVAGPIPVLKLPEMFYYRLDKENFGEKYPLDTTRLLNHLLEGESRPFYRCHELIKLFDNISKTLPSDDIKPLKEYLFLLGCFP